jgi:hypothetical protein
MLGWSGPALDELLAGRSALGLAVHANRAAGEIGQLGN